jgi:O-glycosyl hydrolase
MLVDTNEMIINEEAEDDSNKKSNKRQGQKRMNATPDQDIEGSKEGNFPALVMWYLPVIDRLKRIFSNPRDAVTPIFYKNKILST